MITHSQTRVDASPIKFRQAVASDTRVTRKTLRDTLFESRTKCHGNVNEVPPTFDTFTESPLPRRSLCYSSNNGCIFSRITIESRVITAILYILSRLLGNLYHEASVDAFTPMVKNSADSTTRLFVYSQTTDFIRERSSLCHHATTSDPLNRIRDPTFGFL